MLGRGILAAVTLVLGGEMGNASSASPAMLVQLFEDAREKLPCIELIPEVAEGYSLKNTGVEEYSDTYVETEFANVSGDMFLLFSKETQENEVTYAVSVSMYNSGEQLPAEITLAYMDIWDLPSPTPFHGNPRIAAFSWDINFPNGPNMIIISYSNTSDMVQIYGRIAAISKEISNGCPH